MASACSFRPYRLSSRLHGHEKDVKAVCSVASPAVGDSACLASGSRDRTVRVWSPALGQSDSGATQYVECLGLCSHAGYVNAVAWMSPSDWCPGGLLYSAGMDKVILAFTLESPEPVARLEGHEANVCSLTCASGQGSRLLLSASWDRTARVWHRNLCVCVLSGGHEAAVWSAISFDPEEATIVTAGADRLVKLWSLSGVDLDRQQSAASQSPECLATLTGHTDVVRGLCRLPRGRFLSCSNDCTIRLWRLHADKCQVTFEGHTGFVYSLAAVLTSPETEDIELFASSSEDRTCRIWSLDSGACLQTVAMPCQSVWTVCCLVNGDLAVAGSDSVIHLFTSSASRIAPAEELTAFETEVADSAIPTKIGDLDTEKLPGPEILANPGRREGQVVMVKRGARIEAHQWMSDEARWQKVGDVVGGQGGETVSGGGGGGGKTHFEGQDYDFVFTVDVKEGEPPLKLPYNRTEDPWFAAQRFIDKHSLPQGYLDQVAGFIRSNAGEAPTISSHGGVYTDPYTGAGRYIPGGGGGGGGVNVAISAYSDPFTGGSRYVPGGGGGEIADGSGGGGGGGFVRAGGVTAELKARYLPHRQLQILSAANAAGLKKKLGEMTLAAAATSSSGGGLLRLPDGLLDRVDALMEHGGAAGSSDGQLLVALATATKSASAAAAADCVPLLDLLRLACRFDTGAAAVATNSQQGGENGDLLTGVLGRFLGATSSGGTTVACQMLAARLAANLAGCQAGSAWLCANRDWLLTALDRMEFAADNANWQIAVASALCNLCVLLPSSAPAAVGSSSSGKSGSDASLRLLTSLHRFLTAAGAALKDEAAFLAVVSVGTLLVNADDRVTATAKDIGFKALIGRFTDTAYPVRVTEAATVVACLV